MVNSGLLLYCIVADIKGKSYGLLWIVTLLYCS